MTIGEKIRFYREKRGFTQTMLSQATGIPLGTIKKYEISNRKPKSDAMEKIALALRVSPNVFYDLKSETIGDLTALFFFLAQEGKIHFYGEKDSEGKYDINSLTFSFDSPLLKHCLKDWADTLNIINTLRAQADTCTDETVKNMLLTRADEVQREAEYTHISSQILVPKDTPNEH